MVYQLILVTTFQTNIGGVKLALNSAMKIMKQLSPCAEKFSRKVMEIYNFDVAPIPTLHLVVRIYNFPLYKNENPQFATFLHSVLVNQHELKLFPFECCFTH